MAAYTDMSLREAVARAVNALPLWPREVYRLCAVEGLDQDAVAKRLGIGRDAVEALLAEAIVRIGRHLDREASG